MVLTFVVILSVLGSVGMVAAQEVTTLEQSETEVTAAPGETVELTTTFNVDGLNGQGVDIQLPADWTGEITEITNPLNGFQNTEDDGNVLQVVWTESGDYEVTYQVDVPEDAEEGDYTVDVEGSGLDPETDDRIGESTQTTITVEEPNTAPTADAGDDQTVDEGDSVTLDASGSSDQDGDALTYQWTQTAGPDVTLSDADTATPSFSAPEVDDDETLTFELEVSDGQASDTDTVDVTVQDVPEPNQGPTAAFTVDPTSPAVDEDVTLDASSAEDSDGEIVSYEWSVDGETLDDTGETVTTSFDAAGDYDVTLTVEDDDGATDETTQTVSVSEAPDPAEFQLSDLNVESPVTQGDDSTVTATVENVGDEEGTQTVALDVDDSEVDTESVTLEGDATQEVSFDVDTADLSVGDHDVTLSTDDDSVSTTLTVTEETPTNEDPSAAFDVSPSDPVTDETVTFDASASTDDGSIESYEWDFGDGETATGESVTHAYGDAGDYDVTLTVTDDDGATDTATQTVSVSEAPEEGPPPVGNFENAPTDPDGDGLYEDVNGDGEFTIVDVQALFANLDDETVNDERYLDAFDFNQDGEIDVVDVQKLYTELSDK